MTTPNPEVETTDKNDFTRQASGDVYAPPQPLTWTQTVLSGLSAAIGIQNAAARDRDFKRGSLFRFVLVGTVLTVLFIGTLVLVVTSVAP